MADAHPDPLTSTNPVTHRVRTDPSRHPRHRDDDSAVDDRGAAGPARPIVRSGASWQAGVVQWSPPTLVPASLAAGSLVLGAVTVLLDDAGRVLVGAAALLLLALACRDLLLRPRLAAAGDGVEVRTLTGRRVLPWGRLRVRVRATRRWGTTVRTLELDTAAGPDEDGELVVLGRWDLGADPRDVARALESAAG